MPELTVTLVVLVAALAIAGSIAGAAAGWIARDRRAAQDKAANKMIWQREIRRYRKEQHRLDERNKALAEQMRKYQAHLVELKKQEADLTATALDADVRHTEMQRELEARDAQIDALSLQLKSWQDRLPPLIERFRSRDAEAGRLESTLNEALATIRRLEERDDDAVPVFLDEKAMVGSTAAPGDDNATAAAKRDAGAAVPDVAPTERDNLQQIKGVGPAIEKTLNEMGIFSFSQLAELGDYDIDRIARRLKGFQSRIEREDWIGQARTLLGKARPPES